MSTSSGGDQPQPSTSVEVKSTPVRQAKWICKLGGGVLDETLYAVAEFLRGKPFLRGLVFLLAVTVTVLLVLTYTGLFKGLTALSALTMPLFFFVVPAIFRMAIYSGDDFKIVFITAEAKKNEEIAEEKFNQTGSPEDAVNLDETRLNSYYEINQAQAKAIFRWAVGMMVIGFSTIVAGIWIFYFRQAKADVLMTSLTTAAGMISNLISGLFLYLHHKTQERSFQYYEELADLQRVRVAMKLANSNMVDADRAATLQTIVSHLLNRKTQVTKSPKKLSARSPREEVAPRESRGQ